MPSVARRTTIVRTMERFGVELDWKYQPDLIEAIEHEGWNQAGQGNFGTVLVRGNEAIKVFDDQAYTQYLLKVVRPDCPAFPRVLSPIYRGNQLSIVHLERLEPAGDEIADYFRTTRDKLRLCFAFGSISDEYINVDEMDAMLGYDAVGALALIFDLAKARGYVFDGFYASNVMRRKGYDGVVFTDPVAKCYES